MSTRGKWKSFNDKLPCPHSSLYFYCHHTNVRHRGPCCPPHTGGHIPVTNVIQLGPCRSAHGHIHCGVLGAPWDSEAMPAGVTTGQELTTGLTATARQGMRM